MENKQPSPAPISFSKRLKFVLEYAFARPLVGLCALVPLKWTGAAGRVLGAIAGTIIFPRNAIAKKNLLQSFPEMTGEEADAVIKKCWTNLGQGLVEVAKTPQITPETFGSYVEIRGLEHLKASHAKGKGLVLLSSHFGSYEFSGQFLAFSGMKTAVIARRIKNPYVNDFVTRLRTFHGVGVILARNAVRESIRWLKGGNVLGVLIDQRIVDGGLLVPFFGRPAYTTSLPAILALRYEIPIHPIHCWREGGKIILQADPAMDFSGLSQKEEDIFEATRRMNAVLETWIRERPELWLWIHNRWKI